MSRSRGTRPLAITFLALLAASVVVELTGGVRFGSEDTRQSLEPLFADHETGSVQRLVITGPGDERVELVRQREHWSVGADPTRIADPTAVRRILEELEALPQGRVLEQDPDNPERYGLEGPDAIVVRALGEGDTVLAEVVIGRQQDYRATFLRRAGETAVRRIESTVRRTFRAPSGTGWRDRTILAAGPAEDIRRIQVEGPAGHLVFERGTPDSGVRWRMVEPREGIALAWRIDSMARLLSDLQCDRFHDGTPPLGEIGLAPPDLVATAERADGSTTVLHLGQSIHDDRRAVQRPEDGAVWWIQAFHVDTFLQPVESYLQDP